MRTLLTTKSLLLLVPLAVVPAGYVAYENISGSSPVVTRVAGASAVKVDSNAQSAQDKASQDKAAPKEPNGDFSIAGATTGLYPGVRLPLTLTLTNPQSFGIRVTSLMVGVADPSGVPAATTQCTAGVVQIALPGGQGVRTGQAIPVSVIVPKKGSATTQLEVRMVADAPNACQGASFGLSYSGSAVKS